MSYLVLRALLTFEDGLDKSVVLEEITEDLITYRKLLIEKTNAINAYLSYEQKDSSDSDSNTSFIDYIKPLDFKASVG